MHNFLLDKIYQVRRLVVLEARFFLSQNNNVIERKILMNNEQKVVKGDPQPGHGRDDKGHNGNHGNGNNGGGHGRPRTPGTSHPMVTKWNGK